MRAAFIAASFGAAVSAQALIGVADTSVWNKSDGNFNWSDAANWVSGDIPNGTDEDARFDTPTAARNIDLNGQFTVAGIEFNNSAASTFTNSIRNFNISGDLLTFDAPGAGPAFIRSSGIAANQNRLQSEMVFTDDVVATVSNTVGNATAGALSLTGNVTGPGGFTKAGDGMMTVAFNAGDSGQIKAWEGPTFVTGGRWRTSLGGTNGMLTESFTINGGQLTMINPNPNVQQTFTFGPGPLNLNGFGPTSGPFAQFAGAIRPDTNNLSIITNNVAVQTDASIAIFGTATALTLTGVISGPSSATLYLDAIAGQPTNHGTLIVSGANSYAGGTNVVQGTFRLSGASATMGTGDVLVDGVSDRGNGILGSGKLDIQSGVSNGIADAATVTLTGGTFGGQAILGAGVNELIGGLVLGGTPQTNPGTYGSTASGATFQNDLYFQGSGVFTLALAAQPGDHNKDGKVDAADYVAWRKSPGSFGGDPGGYNAFFENFGEGIGGGGGAAGVPEPATLVIVSLLATIASASRRMRRVEC